tara:strand:- start:1846 stop:2811 length:966 start_codon:yes stop_codon:yes gene_type:complete
MDKISILGGSGFLGNSLVKLLEKRNLNYVACDISVPENTKHAINLDVESETSLNQLEGTKILINLAAEHHDNVFPVSRYDDVNVEGARKICDAARRLNIKQIIFTSSVAVYGFAPPETDETGEINYFNDYGRTKFLAENIYKEWFLEDTESRSLTIVRPTVIFGEGNRGNVYNLLNQISSKRFVIFGDGKNYKSMAYVENVASFLEHCLTLNSGFNLFNYSDKPDMNMNDLVKLARKNILGKDNLGIHLPRFLGLFLASIFDVFSFFMRKNLPISKIRVKKFMETTQFSSSEIKKTDFKPKISLEEGLIRTIEYEFNSKDA